MRLHVIPFRDTHHGEKIDHAASSRCSCFPLEEKITSERDGSVHSLFIHNAFDLREKWARQDPSFPDQWVSVEEL
jgi:hypothetical protein